MSNVNGIFMAPGFGNAAFYVTHVAYGVASSVDEAEAANFRTAYFHNVWTADFYISLVFNSWDAYQAGADWFRGYMTSASDPNNTSLSPMTVVVPSKNFYSQGIPEMGISYGDHVPAITYPMTVSFVASVSSISPTEMDDAPPTSLRSQQLQVLAHPELLRDQPRRCRTVRSRLPSDSSDAQQ